MDQSVVGGANGLCLARAAAEAAAASDDAVAGLPQSAAVVARLRGLLEELEFTEREFCAEIGGRMEEAELGLLQEWVARLDWARRRLALKHVSDDGLCVWKLI